MVIIIVMYVQGELSNNKNNINIAAFLITVSKHHQEQNIMSELLLVFQHFLQVYYW